MVSLCTTCNSAIAKRAISPLSAGNFVNCLFCQDYPEALKNLNTVEEAFIARAHVIGIFLKLTSGAKGGIGYRGSRGHSEAVRQDPNELLKTYSRRRKHVANEREQGVSHATDPNASKVLGKVQEKVPNGVEDALPDRIHPTPADDNVGKGVSHATGKSIVPQKLQEKLPEKVERAVPNAIHDTSDPVRDIKKWIVL
ncbi:hypothetical protein DL95DRAFT_286521 [Leptodontidium sp. 2 PMI_412]|nr:hypothetical protein DL95DRAFT_286521 [Leptodontidium sp. 2 PMI_412]